MILVRRNPFEPMITMCDEMHRRFHESVGQVRGDGAAEVAGTWEPPVDIYETDDAIVLQVELPGVSKDAVTCRAPGAHHQAQRGADARAGGHRRAVSPGRGPLRRLPARLPDADHRGRGQDPGHLYRWRPCPAAAQAGHGHTTGHSDHRLAEAPHPGPLGCGVQAGPTPPCPVRRRGGEGMSEV